jgi:fatty-acyl-CoA synthase
MQGLMSSYPLTLTHVFHRAERIFPEKGIATSQGDEIVRTTYGEWAERTRRLAGVLDTLGISADGRVGTFAWNSARHLELYFAAPCSGRVLHTLNIRLFPDDIVYIADHAEDEVIFADRSLLKILWPLVDRFETVKHVVVMDDGEGDIPDDPRVRDYETLLAEAEPVTEFNVEDENQAAAMCYTSGTTGHPKGVVYSHRSIYLHSMQVCMGDGFTLNARDRVLAVVPMFHAMAWGLPYAALMVGTSLIMPDRFLTPEPLAALIAAEKPTIAGAVPTIWTGLLSELDKKSELGTPVDVSSLRDVVIGGSACPPALMKAFEERHGVHITHAWGMTEISPLGSVGQLPANVVGEQAWAYRVTQGRLVAGVQARLVAPDGTFAPHDGKSVGEIEIRGPWTTASYYKDDDPEKFHDGWLRTGDVGSITPDGFLTLTDRSKDVIKSGGEWISSVELENALMGHPAVAEASVIGVPDEKWGERPLASIVVRDGEKVEVDELRAFLSDKVAAWQLPERWAFIEEVPKTSVGKFDKKVLRKQYADGALSVQTARAPDYPAT